MAVFGLLVLIYGGGGCIVGGLLQAKPLQTLLGGRGDPRIRQAYVLFNCVLVSLFYLRGMPNLTAWCVLLLVAGWGSPSFCSLRSLADAFAVLSRNGPLRRAQERAHEFSANVSNKEGRRSYRLSAFSCTRRESPPSTRKKKRKRRRCPRTSPT